MKTTALGRRPATSKAGKVPRRRLRLPGACLAAVLALLCSCGELRPVPPAFEARAYTPMECQELLHPGPGGLQAGQMVRVKAYFWQFLDYDPAMVRSYLSLARHPLGWPRLRWFAVYGSEEMTGYYDLAALSPEQAEKYQIKRMDHIMVYGELSRLTPGVFLQVHHIEKIEEP